MTEADAVPPAAASAVELPAQQAAGRVQMIAAIGLIVVFVVFLVVLYFSRDDKYWDRLVFLLAGFEAIVFAAAGALFGTTVQRATVQIAQQDAAVAKADAAAARTKAEEARSEAEAGVALLRIVQEKAATHTSALVAQGGRPREVAAAAPTELDELARIANALFPGRA